MIEIIPGAWWMKSDGCLGEWMNCLWSKPSVHTTNFSVAGSHLRKDEEEGGRADQEAGGRAHRDEGAGSQ